MLIIRQYGINLIRIEEKDIELVRQWRNSPMVAAQMEYREYISPEAQKEWFRRINNKYNYYFIIEFEGQQVGLVNAKDCYREQGFGEGGIFMADEKYIGSMAFSFATLCMLNFFIIKAKMAERSRAHVLKTNLKVIQYNKLLGYKLLPGQEHIENQVYELSLEDYLYYGAKLNRAAALLSGEPQLTLIGTVGEDNREEINELLFNQAKTDPYQY